jgi:LmbE family N-acetylglucosaminyl deacetylase
MPRTAERLALRVKRKLPERAWPLLRTAASIGGDVPLVGLPDLRRVVVLAPHPDDEALGAGGTVALLAASGTEVVVAVASDGEATPDTGLVPDEIARRRREETAVSCAALGVPPPRFWGRPDGGLARCRADLAASIGRLLAEVDADGVFLPWFGDGHPDHRALTPALADAGPPAALSVWAYEAWTPLPANRLVDVTSAIDRKQAAVAAHVTAHAGFDVSAMIALSRYRSVHGLAGHGWAEAFLVAPAQRYLALARDSAVATTAASRRA